MEFRIFSFNPADYVDSGIKVYDHLGLEWFVDTKAPLVPALDKDDPHNFHSFMIKRWCEENCKDNVAALIHNSNQVPYYFFSDPEDAVLFKLTWT